MGLEQVVVNAGHSANETGIASELVAANEKFKYLVKNVDLSKLR